MIYHLEVEQIIIDEEGEIVECSWKKEHWNTLSHIYRWRKSDDGFVLAYSKFGSIVHIKKTIQEFDRLMEQSEQRERNELVLFQRGDC